MFQKTKNIDTMADLLNPYKLFPNSFQSLTVYDMCKAMSKDIIIEKIQLESKTGGKSGDFHRV